MPILNFPASPNNGDTFTQNNIQWQYNSVYGVWNVISAGPTGFMGSVGFTGSKGDIGFTGSKGDSGFIGSGATGFTGSVGFTGSKGDTGFTGSKGDTGFTGSKGDSGFIGSGATGFTGSVGFIGSKGDIGFTGSKGDSGFVGSGAIGFTGSVGFTGSRGSVDTPTNDTTTNATYYPVVAIATDSATLKTSSTKLTFNPSTGRLTATSFSGDGANITGVPAQDDFARTFAILGY